MRLQSLAPFQHQPCQVAVVHLGDGLVISQRPVSAPSDQVEQESITQIAVEAECLSQPPTDLVGLDALADGQFFQFAKVAGLRAHGPVLSALFCQLQRLAQASEPAVQVWAAGHRTVPQRCWHQEVLQQSPQRPLVGLGGEARMVRVQAVADGVSDAIQGSPQRLCIQGRGDGRVEEANAGSQAFVGLQQSLQQCSCLGTSLAGQCRLQLLALGATVFPQVLTRV